MVSGPDGAAWGSAYAGSEPIAESESKISCIFHTKDQRYLPTVLKIRDSLVSQPRCQDVRDAQPSVPSSSVHHHPWRLGRLCHQCEREGSVQRFPSPRVSNRIDAVQLFQLSCPSVSSISRQLRSALH